MASAFHSSIVPLAALAVVLACSPRSALADDVTPERLAAASTAADHEAIASAYDAEATAAERRAAEHRSRSRAYASRNVRTMWNSAMARHCTKLAELATAQAREYRALAAEHRRMAHAAPTAGAVNPPASSTSSVPR